MSTTPDTPDYAGTSVSATGELVATLVFAPLGPSPQAVSVPAWASSLELHGITPPLGPRLSVTGNTSGIVYFDSNQGFGLLQLPIKVDIPVSVDPVVEVGVLGAPPATMTVYVVARDDASGLNSTSQPVIVDNLNVAWSGATATAGSAASAVLLGAPLAGNAWEIGILGLAYTGAVTSAAFATIHGTTSGVALLGVSGPTGSDPYDNLNGERVLVGEGLTVTNNASGHSVIGSVWARQVLLYYNNGV